MEHNVCALAAALVQLATTRTYYILITNFCALIIIYS